MPYQGNLAKSVPTYIHKYSIRKSAIQCNIPNSVSNHANYILLRYLCKIYLSVNVKKKKRADLAGDGRYLTIGNLTILLAAQDDEVLLEFYLNCIKPFKVYALTLSMLKNIINLYLH